MKIQYSAAGITAAMLIIALFFAFPPKKQGETLRIAYIAPMSGNSMSYWKDVENGLAAGSSGLDLDLVFFSQPEVDERIQLSHFIQAINQDFDGIITMALNPETFTPIINRASQEGIPVILLDGDAPNSRRLSFFGSNNYEAGLMVAELIDTLVPYEVRLGVVTAGITLRHITDRLDGIQTYFADREDLHLLVVEDSRANEATAYQKTESIILGSDVNVVFAAGAVDSLGVARALEVMVGEGRQILGIGFDDTPETLDYVREGILAACIAQSPYEMGRRAVRSLYAHLQGVKDDMVQGIFYTPVTVVTPETIDSYKSYAKDAYDY